MTVSPDILSCRSALCPKNRSDYCRASAREMLSTYMTTFPVPISRREGIHGEAARPAPLGSSNGLYYRPRSSNRPIRNILFIFPRPPTSPDHIVPFVIARSFSGKEEAFMQAGGSCVSGLRADTEDLPRSANQIRW